jgi:hypothetical protein
VVLALLTEMMLLVFSRLVLDSLVAMVALVRKTQQMAEQVAEQVATQLQQLLA